MLSRFASLVLALLLLAAPLLPAAAQSDEETHARIEAIHGDAAGFFALLDLVREALASDDAAAISQYAFYPLLVNADGKSQEVPDEQDFLDGFDTLFPAQTRQAVLDQDSADLIITSEGVGIGSGALWITNVCLDDACGETRWGIISINN